VVPVVAELEEHQAQVLEELEVIKTAAAEAAAQAAVHQEMVVPAELE
jgi:hypothetical protein